MEESRDAGRLDEKRTDPDLRAAMRRVTDSRVEWSASLPGAGESFERILCGAAIWQLDPLLETFEILAGLLRPGGALCFNIPALYLLEPDEPGGGSHPSLLSLPTFVGGFPLWILERDGPRGLAGDDGRPPIAGPNRLF